MAFNLKIAGNNLLAISLGYQKVNNYSELDEVELSDKKSITDPQTGTVRTYEEKIKARTGDYKTFDQIPINLDWFRIFKNNPRLGSYHYLRTKVIGDKASYGFGSGLYLLKKDNPLSAITGVVFEVNDISKLKDGYGKNFVISFVVAYNFGF